MKRKGKSKSERDQEVVREGDPTECIGDLLVIFGRRVDGITYHNDEDSTGVGFIYPL